MQSNYGAQFVMLAALIASDEVKVNSEDEVLEAVLRWLDYDRPGRQLHLLTVLQTIRAPFLSAQSRLQYDLALESAAVGMVDELAGEIRQNSDNTTPRHSVGAHEVMLCVSVYDADSKGTAVQVFDPSIPVVWGLKKLPLPADCRNAVMLDDRWMMISSVHGWKTVQRDRRFTGLDDEWGPPVAKMLTWRGAEALAVLDGRVYVAGGYEFKRSQPVLSSVEVYDFPGNSWSALADLPVPRMHVVMVAHGGLLYAFGGDIEEDNASNLVHAYHPAENTWSRLADMPTGRDGGRANDLGICAHVEAYKPVTNQWLGKGDLVQPRMDPGCVCLGGKLYVLGGYAPYGEDDAGHLSIEVYDDEADRWTLHECRLLSFNLGFACVKMKLKRA
ncbi:kelch-like protein diablo [Paramacrobiotus metropolitanus]|uniref:kelch-like protein diablo n=1 Tax=Paramacrobiotus metropolitanus TaxID=2943436 RepID=UPI002446056A|nr:kelch-like protein diablo [Paramacrobiotus metropolitanus]